MAKKAKAQQKSVMQQLQEYSPPWSDGPEDEVKRGQDDQVKTLTEQVAALEAKLDGFQRQDAYRSFQSSPSIQAVQQKPADAPKTTLDLTGLPDPVAEGHEKYNAALMQRMNEVMNARDQVRQAEAQMAAEQADLTNTLWSGFQKAQPDWAEHEMLVGAAAGRVSQNLQARGVNVVQLMKQQPDLFYGEVAALLEKQYPQLKGKAGAGEEDDEDEGGQADVFGGQVGGKGGALSTAAVSLEDDNKAFMRELGEWRVKNGVR